MKLYSDNVEHTKLTKYHFSKTHAVFFFSYRRENKGAHFFLIISLQDLWQLIPHNKCLINEDATNIFIMQAIDQIQSIPFNHDNIDEYCNFDKEFNRSSNELVFELTRDMADPTKDYFPFLFY